MLNIISECDEIIDGDRIQNKNIHSALLHFVANLRHRCRIYALFITKFFFAL